MSPEGPSRPQNPGLGLKEGWDPNVGSECKILSSAGPFSWRQSISLAEGSSGLTPPRHSQRKRPGRGSMWDQAAHMLDRALLLEA